MRYILILCLLLSCTKEEVKPCSLICFHMTISDSLPIQFWINGEQTFNEKVICGLAKQDCFCQPFECDDELMIQFQDDDGFNYQLIVQDTSESDLAVLDFDQISEGIYEATFIPSGLSPSICEKVSLKIMRTEFSPPISNFTQFGGGVAWVDGQADLTSVGGAVQAKYFKIPFNATQGVNYQVSITLNYTESGTGPETQLFVGFTNGETTPFDVQDQEVYTTNDTYTTVFSLTPTQDTDALVLYAFLSFIGTPSQSSIEIVSVSIDIEDELVAKSDCIDLKESHDCTTLIEYSNSSDFDGIVYETSPQPSFFLRIPAMFHEEDNPMTQEDLELSNGVIVTLRQTLQEKRLLETGYMPNYMHKKLQKVLMHEEITIDGTQWKRRDSYEADPIKKYNLKRAEVLLTKYNSVEKNTI